MYLTAGLLAAFTGGLLCANITFTKALTVPLSKLDLTRGIRCDRVAVTSVSVSGNGSVKTSNSSLFMRTIGLKLLPDGMLEMMIADSGDSHAALPFYHPVKIAGDVVVATDTHESEVRTLVIDLRRGSVFWTSAYANRLHSGSVTLLQCVEGGVPRD